MLNRSLIIVGAILAASFLAGCHNPYQSGLDALSEGNYDEAEENAREGLKEDPQAPEYNLLLADAYVGRGEFQQAEPHAQKAFDSGKLPAAAGRTLGKVRWELGQPILAVDAWRAARAAESNAVSNEDFSRALETALAMAMSVRNFEAALTLRGELKELNPDHPECTPESFRRTREQYADELVRNGEFQLAVETYDALAEEFGDAEYHFERGRLYASLRNDTESKRAFEKYVASGPEDEKGKRLMEAASRAERLGAIEVALHFYDQAVSSMDKPTASRAKVHLKLAVLLLNTQMVDQAKPHLDAYVSDMKAVRGEPVAAQVYLKVANAAAENRAPQLSIAYLEEALVSAQPSWRAARTLADLYARRARTSEVERVLRTYVEREKSKGSARVNVARWAMGRLNFDLAVFFFEAAVQDGAKVTPTVWLELARAYAALGRMDEVNRALKTYTGLVKDKRRALLDVAEIYRRQRMYEEAEKSLNKLMKSDAADLHIARQLETLYREWGRPKKIHDVYDKWLKARGNDPVDYQLVGERFFRQNEWDEALPYLTKAAKLGETSAWLQVADIYKRQRKERDMKKALDAYLAASKDRVPALSLVWQRYRTSAWSHEAIPILEELITVEPLNVSHYEQLSELYFEQGRDVEAFELWKKYIELSRDPMASLEAMTQRFERQGYHDWMLAFLHQIKEKHNNPDPEIYRLLGDAHYAATSRRSRLNVEPDPNAIFSEQNKAKSFYEKYLELASPSPRDLQKFATSMRQKRMWDVAAKAYEQLDMSAPMSTHMLLDYGGVLLQLGKSAEAKKVFADYYARRGESVDAARSIADELSTAQQYDALEPYLSKMMESGDELLLRTAFMQLAEVYRQTDRGQKISNLATQYLSKTQNPTEARRTVLGVLEGAGQWEEAVEQLERIAEVQGDEFKFELGEALFRAGDLERADAVFRDYATSSVTPQEAWLRVGNYYEVHAQADLAQEAYNMAVSAGQSSDRALSERGRLRLMRGMIQEGQADFEEARSRVEQSARRPIWKLEVETLLLTGRYAAAAEISRRALVGVMVERDFFFSAIATSELTGSDPQKAERMVDELKGAGLPADDVVPILLRHGYLEDAAKLIEDEIANGDYVAGGQLAVTHADVFSELGGIERLLRTLQPLLERGTRDGRLKGQVGEYLVREGQVGQGVLYLRAAIDEGEKQYRPVLASAYLKLGHDSEALDLYQEHLDAVIEVGRGIALRSLAAQMELAGRGDMLEALLRHLIADDKFASQAAPILAKRLIAQGDVSEAMSLVRGMWLKLNVDSEAAMPNLEERLEMADAVLVEVAEVIAGEGYLAEAMTLIEEAPSSVGDTERVRDLKLRLAASSPDIDTEKEVELAMLSLGESNSEALQKLKIARLLMLAGDSERAIKLSEPMLTSGSFDVAREALRVLTASAVASGDSKPFEGWIKTFVENRPDKVNARAASAEAMRILAVDDVAVELLKENLAKVPTDSNIRAAVRLGYDTGDQKLVESSTEMFWRIAREPATDVQNMSSGLVDRHPPEMIELLLRPHRDAFPEIWSSRAAEIRLNYRVGRPEVARELVLEYLERVSYEPKAVEEVLKLMDEYRLYGDMARFVGLRVQEDSLGLRSLEMLGRANVHLGFNDDGLAQLDRYVDRSPDPAHAATNLAATMLDQGRAKEALRFAELALDKRPGRVLGQLYRAMARVALGDSSGTDELDNLLKQGVNRRYALYLLGRLAVTSNQPELAQKYLKELAGGATSESPGTMMRWSIEAYRQADRPNLAVKFVEENWPMVSAGNGIAGEEVLPQLASLYESAELQERSFQLYHEGIQREIVAAPFEDTLNTYRNNLAYTFSTTNQNVEDGFPMIRLAIAGDRKRNPSFIDTLGWLEYRTGNYAQAELEVRRSLSSSLGSAQELEELYSHLADLREARGFHRESVWIRIFVDSIKN